MSLLEEHIRVLEEQLGMQGEKLDAMHHDIRWMMSQLVYMVQGTDLVLESVQGQSQRIGKVEEKTQGLSPMHQRLISGKVSAIVKSSTMTGMKIDYQTIFWKLNGHFHVAKYSQITDDRFEEVMRWLDQTFFEPPAQQGKLF